MTPEHAFKLLTAWAADQRERQGRHDSDARTYKRRAEMAETILAEIERLQAEIDRRTGKRKDCQVCGEEVPFAGAVFCSVACCKAAEKAGGER